MTDNIVIFKNDRTGDLITSLPAIYQIIKDNNDKNIIIYLSEINYKMKFLLEAKGVKINLVKYKLNIIDRLNILKFFIKSKISKVYILRPKNFFFYLPIFFYYKKILFYGFCLDGKNNYKRPNNFLRRLLKKYVINDRGTKGKRISREKLQIDLLNKTSKVILSRNNLDLEISSVLKNILPKDYILIHYKRKIFNDLGWGINGLEKIISTALSHMPNVILINDIEPSDDIIKFKEKFRWYDLGTNKNNNNNNSKILFLPNISGVDLYNVIKLSKKIIAIHGTITLLGNLIKIPILDLFYCNIINKEDYHRYKNAFHEWKPKNKGYDFIIPNKKIDKSIHKINLFCKK